MNSSAVVILTEPERCELAGPDVLMQAFLQVQQLNKAGLAPSQAFCDHPASAMKFIEAYTKAYPELQLRAADLPLPEQLYSIIADGRVLPLQASMTAETAKPGEASQLYPLYVLSLGAPDALMRAVQHNSFAQSDIKVVEIAPLDQSDAESVSVADAVAHDGRAGWRTGTLADPDRDDDYAFASAERVTGDPLKLDSVEVNLDHIEVDRKDGEVEHYDRALDDPAPTVMVPLPASGAAQDAGAGPPISLGGAAPGGSAAAEPTPTTAGISVAPLEGGISPSPPAAVASPIAEASVLPDASVTAPADPDGTVVEADPDEAVVEEVSGGTPDDPAPAGSDGPPDTPELSPEPGELHAPAPGELHAGPDSEAAPEPVIESAPEGTPDEASEPETVASADSPGGPESPSFGDPGGDVLYPPNASFAMDDDVSYPLPEGIALPWFGDLFDGSTDGEVVDLEALFEGLSEPPGASAEVLDDLDLRLPGTHGASSGRTGDAGRPGPAPDASVPGRDGSASDQDDPSHERLPVSHDLDI
jgi:hypothetical protein